MYDYFSCDKCHRVTAWEEGNGYYKHEHKDDNYCYCYECISENSDDEINDEDNSITIKENRCHRCFLEKKYKELHKKVVNKLKELEKDSVDIKGLNYLIWNLNDLLADELKLSFK